ncbi:hypothetical protein TSUD_270410 [Trifolium subterraneum]|uniref:Pentatricopeptide repeat-containing protein n=1 Tax=Trifolium subterraneum TaxID=3900 RepID=A0A2Z6P953_TRISU|nr:hypothetical protein TSUD_270410 [Trifolium subterraneum]
MGRKGMLRMVNQWMIFWVFDEMKSCDDVRSEFLMNSLIDMYCNCDSISRARKLFEGLQLKDTVSWISLISGYEKHGDALKFLNFSVKCSGKVELQTK